jgi:hypothetical protein
MHQERPRKRRTHPSLEKLKNPRGANGLRAVSRVSGVFPVQAANPRQVGACKAIARTVLDWATFICRRGQHPVSDTGAPRISDYALS